MTGPLTHDVEALRQLQRHLTDLMVELTRSVNSGWLISAADAGSHRAKQAIDEFFASGKEGHQRVTDAISTASHSLKQAAESYEYLESCVRRSAEKML